MKKLFIIIISTIVIVGLIVSAFTLIQVHQEQTSMVYDLERRTALLADSLKEAIRPSYVNKTVRALQNMLNKFSDREGLLGIAVYNNTGDIFAVSADLSTNLTSNTSLLEIAINTDSDKGDFSANRANGKVYMFATPLHQDEKIIGALVVFQDAGYIDVYINKIRKNNLVRLLIQATLFSVAIILILYLVILGPILRMVESIRIALSGEVPENFDHMKNNSFLGPVAAGVSKMTASLLQARTAASEEARLRLEKADSPWTEERLKEFINVYLKDSSFFVVSNREPYIHKKIKNKIQCVEPASGMITALEPIMKACGGLRIANGSGDADRLTVDQNDKIPVPPLEHKYTLKRVRLSDKEIQGYYNGFCNGALRPLCHMVHTRPIFRKEDWAEYRKVNGKFAQTLLNEIKNVQRPVILIQDYHFALVPEMIKKSRPDVEIGIFRHIPWPNEESFGICPWRKEILAGMLGADVIGFHTQQYCNNFFTTVSKEIESLIDMERFAITYHDHTTNIKPFPISVAFTNDKDSINTEKSDLPESLNIKTKYIGIGVDRLDYTKGILEKLRGIEFFFDMYPAYKEQFTLLQIAPISRKEVKKYQQFNEDVTNEVERINEKFASGGWQPIVFLKEYYTHEEIYPLYRAANVCLVTSLSDGMNLVAKEFVAARNDESGVLILSELTGAAKDLKEAIKINPYSAEQMAEAIHQGLNMPLTEQRRRMKKMRESIKNYNIYRWAAEFIKVVTNLQ